LGTEIGPILGRERDINRCGSSAHKTGRAGRIGDDAAEELRKVVEEFAIRVGKEALELATHAGRKTVRSEDIRLAVKRIQKE